MSENPFVTHGMAYWAAGWHGVLRLPFAEKDPPPGGETGPDAPYFTRADLGGLIAEHVDGRPYSHCLPVRTKRRTDEGVKVSVRFLACKGRHNIGLRLPEDVIALDVDGYKGAANTLVALEARLGALPATVRNSARWRLGDRVSGHLFFRVPAGKTWKGDAGRGIDVLQAGHRYAVAWPSIHPDLKAPYEWINQAGEVMNEVPAVENLPALPDAWVDFLVTRDRVKGVKLTLRQITEWESAVRPTGRLAPCDPVKAVLAKGKRDLASGKRSRHDTALRCVRALMAFGGEGHVGALEAIEEFEAAFTVAATTGPNARHADVARDEFERLREGAVKIAARRTPKPVDECDCPVFERRDVWRGTQAPASPPEEPAQEPEEPASAPSVPEAPGEASSAASEPLSAPAAPVLVDDVPPVEVRHKAPQFYGATQDGMARAFVDYFGDAVRFVPDGRRSFYVWDDVLWRLDVTEAHREKLRTLMRALPGGSAGEGATEEQQEAAKEWKTFRRSCLSAAGIAGITRLAQSDRRIAVETAKLDADPCALNTPAGIYDLKSGERREHSRDEMITKITSVAPDWAGERARWDQFLAETFPLVDDEGRPTGEPDHDLIAYVQRLIGYSATGLRREHVLPFAYGSGGNGKGVLLETIASLLSVEDATGYAITTANDFLMRRPMPTHRTEIASLAGRRMVITNEVNRGDRFDEARVKALSSDKFVRANFMRGDEFTFPALFTLWLQGNEQPEATTGGRSLLRRLRCIPFVHEVPEDRVEADLVDRLVRECGPAIMAWIIDGAKAYLAQGLDPTPKAVLAATAQYAEDQDHVGRFLREMCDVAETEGSKALLKTAAKALYEAYEAWCREERIPEHKRLTPVHFGRSIKAHKIDSKRESAGMVYLGVTLRRVEGDEEA